MVELVKNPLPWSSASVAEIAAAAGTEDVFVFRRVADRRYAHLGGAGRGVGWAGIVEIGVSEEPLIAAMLADGSVGRIEAPRATHVFGPYYARSAAVVPISSDAFVVFGSAEDHLASVPDGELSELARAAVEVVDEVAAAKRLADELEALHAVQDLLHAPAETFVEGLQRLADQATRSLSCDLGLVQVPGFEPIISDRCSERRLGSADVAAALAEIAAWDTVPRCIQRAAGAELPSPLRSDDGVLAYYVLAVEKPLPGVLVLLHTTAATPRGFTLLCQSLGRKLVDAAIPLLAAALMRDQMRAELEQAEAKARRDPMTGLANRLAWEEEIAGVSASGQLPVSVVALDCRGLKEINETYGHRAGDELLRRVSDILTRSVGGDGLVARLGGDEFGILLYGADEQRARSIVGSIEATLADEGDWSEWGEVEIALAIGASTCRDGDLETTQQLADAEMLAAKRLVRGANASPRPAG